MSACYWETGGAPLVLALIVVEHVADIYLFPPLGGSILQVFRGWRHMSARFGDEKFAVVGLRKVWMVKRVKLKGLPVWKRLRLLTGIAGVP